MLGGAGSGAGREEEAIHATAACRVVAGGAGGAEAEAAPAAAEEGPGAGDGEFGLCKAERSADEAAPPRAGEERRPEAAERPSGCACWPDASINVFSMVLIA